MSFLANAACLPAALYNGVVLAGKCWPHSCGSWSCPPAGPGDGGRPAGSEACRRRQQQARALCTNALNAGLQNQLNTTNFQLHQL